MREINNATAAADLAATERDPEPLPVRTRTPKFIWVLRAACRGAVEKRTRWVPEPSDPFYPADSIFYPPREATNFCASCPVRLECLTYALENREKGVWGGLTERQRKALKRPRVRISCPVCSNDVMVSIKDRAVVQLCLACGTSWTTQRPPKRKRDIESVEARMRRLEASSPRS